MNSDPRQIRHIMGTCKHFTGIQNKGCKVEISYETFRKPSGGLKPMPCFKDENSPDICEKAEWYSEAEATQIDANRRKAVHEYLDFIACGKCPVCKHAVIQRQVGHCVYGSCGHRLYQGTVNKKFTKPQGEKERT